MKIKQLLFPFGALCAGAVILSACGDKEVRATPSNENWKAPEICRVENINEFPGCTAGQQLLFLPPSWGNEQLPVIAAASCDLRYPAVWSKGGLTCIYAGSERKFVSGKQEIVKRKYQGLYDKVKAASDGWLRTDDGEYWRVSQQGQGGAVKVGDWVSLDSAECDHDLTGKELGIGDYSFDARFQVTENHYIYQVHPEYGAIVEIVRPYSHVFIKVAKSKSQR